MYVNKSPKGILVLVVVAVATLKGCHRTAVPVAEPGAVNYVTKTRKEQSEQETLRIAKAQLKAQVSELQQQR